MAEENKREKVMSKFAVAFIIIVMATAGAGVIMHLRHQNAKIVEQLREGNRRIEQELIESKRELENAKQSRLKLQNKLASLKDGDDIAKRDLEAYILHKYKTIPKVVAREVACQTVTITKQEEVPFSLVVGIMEVESQFKPWLISKKGARGLMQVMPMWLKNKKVTFEAKNKYDLHNISTNIKAGIKIYKIHLKEANNDINQALYLYVGKDKTYSDKVFNAMGRFEAFRSTLDTFSADKEPPKAELEKGK